jgi:hypothetical protein
MLSQAAEANEEKNASANKPVKKKENALQFISHQPPKRFFSNQNDAAASLRLENHTKTTIPQPKNLKPRVKIQLNGIKKALFSGVCPKTL